MLSNEKLTERIQRGEPDLLPQLWEQVQSLIRSLANRYRNQRRERCIAAGVTVDDLVQEGYFAVLYAVKAYDPTAGYRFTTYLNYPLKNRFNGAVGSREHDRREPLNSCASLDAPLGVDSDDSLMDIVPDANAAALFEAIEAGMVNAKLRAALDECLCTLSGEERDVVERRYYKKHTRRQIAKQTGIDYHRVGTLELKGLQKLRRPDNLRRIYSVIERDSVLSTGHKSNVEQLAYERLERLRGE